jgi:alpha-amylase
MTHIEDSQEYNANATGVLRVVAVPDAFLFFASAEKYTGEFATSLTSLLAKLGKVPSESVEFHFQRGDFEKWVGRTLGDEDLANRLQQIDRRIRGEELRTALRETIKKRLEEFGQMV